MRKAIARIAMVAAIGMLGVGSLMAQPGPRNGERGGADRRDRMPKLEERAEQMEQVMESLDLTDDQKAQIAELRDEFQAENEGALKEIRELEETLRQQMQNGDRDGAKATRDQIKEKSEALRESAKELREQIAMILTDEQKAELLAARQEHREEGKPGDCPERKEMLDELNLTDAQKQQIKALRDEFQTENAETLQRMKELADQMREQMGSGDKEGAKATRVELKTLRDQLEQAGKALREQIAGTLTDEQKAIFAEHQDELQDCREQHKGDRRGRIGRGANAPATGSDHPADIE